MKTIEIILTFGIYLIGLHLARYFWITKPTHALLVAQIDGIRCRIKIEKDQPERNNQRDIAINNAIKDLLNKAEYGENEQAKGEEKKEQSLWNKIRVFIIGLIYTKNIPFWRIVHEAERHAVELMTVEQVKVRLITASKELRTVNSSEAEAMADKIDYKLDCIKEGNEKCLKALLKESFRMIYEDKDTSYGRLETLQNKAMWLIWATVGIMVIISIVFNSVGLFFAGGVGGLLSQLRRMTKAPKLPTDYGAYWISLFLKPIIGAVAGWGGVYLIYLLAKAHILGSVFLDAFDFQGSVLILNPEVIGLAIASGYSAGLIERITKMEPVTSAIASSVE